LSAYPFGNLAGPCTCASRVSQWGQHFGVGLGHVATTRPSSPTKLTHQAGNNAFARSPSHATSRGSGRDLPRCGATRLISNVRGDGNRDSDPMWRERTGLQKSTVSWEDVRADTAGRVSAVPYGGTVLYGTGCTAQVLYLYYTVTYRRQDCALLYCTYCPYCTVQYCTVQHRVSRASR
jgi:hypothetical protein